MQIFSFKAMVMCVALFGCQGLISAQAASKADTEKKAVAIQKASLLDGKLAFTLPAGYVRSEMPEIDEKAIAQGVSGALYSNQAEKRVLIVTEMPIPMDVQASDNDALVLDGLVTGTLAQQRPHAVDFKELGEKKIVKKNGLGLRQVDTSSTLSGTPVLSTTLVAASGTRSAVLNVVSSAKDPAGHAELVKAIIGQ
ncbi:polyribonucleotide nucleotidyltransferase [Pseudomonas sp. NPDC089734]|uniref:polyribonucleotide nucleotidyltransferase n=1 Tax=Pseudomonas sp. NPDC089734 TaxID=3364469 RepID=UPI0038215B86